MEEKEEEVKKFYVYIHFKKDSLEPFYIGKGSGNRYQCPHGRSRYWNNIVRKHGFAADILKYFDKEQDAFDYEKEMIKFFREEGFKLCNMTDGGEGASGLKQSPEHRSKMSAAHKGKTLSPEHCAKVGKTKIKTIIATNFKHWGRFEIRGGRQEMWALGFNQSAVSKCARCVKKSHKGHSFRFKDTE